jgi:hypothetical protein
MTAKVRSGTASKRFPLELFISIPGQSIKSFSSLGLHEEIKTLNVSANPISDFTGFDLLPALTSLKADRTNITSLKGARIAPSLRCLSIESSPLGNSANLLVMSVISFGSTLKTVNGSVVSDKARELAQKLRPIVGSYLFEGYLLQSISPLIVCQPDSRTPILVDLPAESAREQRQRIEENNTQITELRRELALLQSGTRLRKKSRPPGGDLTSQIQISRKLSIKTGSRMLSSQLIQTGETGQRENQTKKAKQWTSLMFELIRDAHIL